MRATALRRVIARFSWPRLLALVCLVSLPLASTPSASAATLTREGAPAGSQQLTLSVPYSCRFPLVGRQLVTVTLTGMVPQYLASGETFSLTHVTSTATIPDALVNALLLEHRSKRGSIILWVFRAKDASPSILNGASPAIRFGSLALTSGQAAANTAAAAPATVGPFRAGRSGTVVIRPGRFELASWFGRLVCLPASPASVQSIEVPIGKPFYLGIGTGIGALGAASLLGGALLWRQRRKSRRGAPSALRPS